MPTRKAVGAVLRRVLPPNVFDRIQSLVVRTSRVRRKSNRWLMVHCRDVSGAVLSIGSGTGADGEGRFYKDYFPGASSYTTSEVSKDSGADLVLDVRSMPEIEDNAYDCVFCSGVLEHVDDYQAGLSEMWRVLKPGGVLLLGLPFKQALHGVPHDYWRFTEYGIRYLLADHYEIRELAVLGSAPKKFPESYWVKAIKKGG